MINLDAESVCVICNWVNGIGLPYFGLGGFGAAAAAAAAGGFFGGGGFGGGSSSGGGSGSGWPKPYDPIIWRYTSHTVGPDGASQYQPYWPGVSPIPADGMVTPVRINLDTEDFDHYDPIPVEPITGEPTWPDRAVDYRPRSGSAPAARG
jgi:hypothetical protein